MVAIGSGVGGSISNICWEGPGALLSALDMLSDLILTTNLQCRDHYYHHLAVEDTEA